MTMSLNNAPIVSLSVGNTLTRHRGGTIADGRKFINQSMDINLKNGKIKEITGVLDREGNYVSDIYSNIFRRKTKEGSPFGIVERLARNGNGTKTYTINGIRRLKVSHDAGKLSGITLYNSKGLKFGNVLKKLFKA